MLPLPTRITLAMLLGALAVLAALCLSTTLLGATGDMVDHALVGALGGILACALVLDLAFYAVAIVRGAGPGGGRVAGDVLLLCAGGSLLDALGLGGGAVGRGVAEASSYVLGDNATLGAGIVVIAIAGWRARREIAGAAAGAWDALFGHGDARGGAGVARVAARSQPVAPEALVSAPYRVPPSSAAAAAEIATPAASASSPAVPASRPRLRAVTRAGGSGRYRLPPPALFAALAEDAAVPVERAKESELLVETLASYDVAAIVERVEIGPTVATYVTALGRGVRLSRVVGLAEDLSLAFGRKVRVTPAGMGRVGFEIARTSRERVGLRALVEHGALASAGALPIALGVGSRGEPVVCDLAAEPHLLVAGATGSGKSVGVGAMIASLLMSRTPEELQLVLVDPKMVEFAPLSTLPHLRIPVVTDMTAAPEVLSDLAAEMDRRYAMLAGARCRSVEVFNAIGPLQIARIVVIVDELADLLAACGKDAEAPLARLAAKGRAAGIHLILATQRPSVDVIAGTLKANIPARVCYRVASAVDSRVVLDEGGAEQLAGRGDALARLSTADGLRRVQAPHVTEAEISAIVEHWRAERVERAGRKGVAA